MDWQRSRSDRGEHTHRHAHTDTQTHTRGVFSLLFIVQYLSQAIIIVVLIVHFSFFCNYTTDISLCRCCHHQLCKLCFLHPPSPLSPTQPYTHTHLPPPPLSSFFSDIMIFFSPEWKERKLPLLCGGWWDEGLVTDWLQQRVWRGIMGMRREFDGRTLTWSGGRSSNDET